MPELQNLVLVVDSDLPALRRLLRLVSDSGWSAAGAVDATEACALLETCTPSMVLLDPRLPLAEEVIERVRASLHTRLIELRTNGTAFAEPWLWDGQLPKPVDETSLRELLAALPRGSE